MDNRMDIKFQMFWDKETKEKAERAAKELGLNLSAYMRYLINKEFKQEQREGNK